MDPIIGEIKLFAIDKVPAGWLFCDGQLVSKTDYEALYSLIGANFGKPTGTRFCLPDLRGRVPIGTADNYHLGNVYGSNGLLLKPKNIPFIRGEISTQNLRVSLSGKLKKDRDVSIALPCDDSGNTDFLQESPHGNFIAKPQVVDANGNTMQFYSADLHSSTTMHTFTASIDADQEINTSLDLTAKVSFNYGSKTPEPVDVRQPSFGVRFAICYQGIYPADKHPAPARNYEIHSGEQQLDDKGIFTDTFNWNVEHNLGLTGKQLIYVSAANPGNAEDGFICNVIDSDTTPNKFHFVFNRVNHTHGWGQGIAFFWTIIHLTTV